jgi:hypothetical protein
MGIQKHAVLRGQWRYAAGLGRGIAFALGLGCALPVWGASEADLTLKDGPERPLVQSTCAACHSIDYIPSNSVFLDRKGWEAEVNKMVNVFGAPATPQDVPKIVDYLVRNYGK